MSAIALTLVGFRIRRRVSVHHLLHRLGQRAGRRSGGQLAGLAGLALLAHAGEHLAELAEDISQVAAEIRAAAAAAAPTGVAEGEAELAERVRLVVAAPAIFTITVVAVIAVAIPVVADIHFHYKRAIEAAENGAACLRINPGNIGSAERVREVVNAANANGCAIRIGVNGGSLEADIQEKYREPTPEALVESAMRHVDILDRLNFDQFKVSVKASDVFLAVGAYRLLAQQIKQPLHLGITEAGGARAGAVKSAIGLGMLLAEGIGVKGLMNVQFALKDDILYVIEANPRASRTVPFVSKATGVPLAKAASRVMMGSTIADLRAEGMIPSEYDGGSLPLEHPIAVKEAVLPFNRFRRPDGSLLDTLLSPEMKSTGEVMGLATNFGAAYAKGEIAAFAVPPTEGTVFVSVANRDKRTLIFPIQRLAHMGYNIVATAGTAQMLRRNGIECEVAAKVSEAKEGEESIVDKIFNGEIDWILNTPAGSAGARHDGYDIRAAAVHMEIPLVTTVQGVTAAVQGIEAMRIGNLQVRALQELEHGPQH
mgnify:CR=1 FL=1